MSIQSARVKIQMASALLGALLLSAFPARAAFLSYDFEDGATTGWNGNGTTPSVVADPLAPSNKVLKVDDTSATMSYLNAKISTTALDSGVYQIALDLMVTDTGGASTNYGMSKGLSFINGSSGLQSTFTYFTNVTATQISTYGWNGTNYVSGPKMTLNEWYRVTQTVDLDAKTWTWSLTSLTTPGTSQVSAAYPFFGNPGTLNYLWFKTGTATGGVFYVDNVSARAVPEPSAPVLLSASLLAGFLWLRRRHPL